MTKLVNRARGLVVLFVAMVVSVAVWAQRPVEKRPLQQPLPEAQPPILKGSEPKPEDATKAILAAFDKYEVVGMGAAHGELDLDHFILDLIRNPALPSKINDIAVECGNSLYQPILDRYIAGDDVPLEQVRQVWRNTTQPMCAVSAFYEQLFPLVRRINQKLPPAKRLRVLACDPPIDWSKVNSRVDYFHFLSLRDSSIASVMGEEVLSKHRKALMLFGVAHLYHGAGEADGIESAVALYEERYPGVTMVIESGNSSQNSGPFESRAASWPVPSLVQDLTGTWLADWLDNSKVGGLIMFRTGKDGKRIETPARESTTKLSKKVDAYLYLGPQELLLKEPRPAEVFLNKDYMAELKRRAAIMGPGPITDQADPDQVSDRDYDPFLYGHAKKKMMMMEVPGVQPAPLPMHPDDPK